MRVLLPLLLTGLLATGCSEARDAVGSATECASLAADVVSTGLDGIPTEADAARGTAEACGLPADQFLGG